jgi:hypothetical protein
MNNITFDTVCTPITLELRGSDALAVSNSLPDELLESESVVPQLQQSDNKKHSGMQKNSSHLSNFAITISQTSRKWTIATQFKRNTERNYVLVLYFKKLRISN